MMRFRTAAGISLGTLVVLASAKVGMDSVLDQIKAKGESANSAQQMAVAGSDGWLFFTPELRYLGAGPFWGENAATASHVANASAKDPLDPIVDFKDQLSKAGIDLLVVPVPAKAAIYPDKLIPGATVPDAGSRVDATQAEFLKVLNAKGVKTLDLGPVFLQYRKDHPDGQPLYCKTDSHWSGQGIAEAASAIGDYVKKQAWYAAVKKGTYKEMQVSVAADGDLLSMVDEKPGQETFNLTAVLSTGGGTPLIESDPNSPLLLLGDSHNLIFSAGKESGMIFKGAGFPENLTSRIKFAPTVEAVMGSGATPARVNLVRKPEELKGKKLVIWLFTAREFTEGQGWKKVPVIKPAVASTNPAKPNGKAAQKFAVKKTKQ